MDRKSTLTHEVQIQEVTITLKILFFSLLQIKNPNQTVYILLRASINDALGLGPLG